MRLEALNHCAIARLKDKIREPLANKLVDAALHLSEFCRRQPARDRHSASASLCELREMHLDRRGYR